MPIPGRCIAAGCLAGALILLTAIHCAAVEAKGRLATVKAAEEVLFQQFLDRVPTARLHPGSQGGARLTMVETVTDKVDMLLEKVMAILEMDPKLYGLEIVLLPDTEAVHQAYLKTKQRGDEHYLAFYAPLEDTIYLSMADVSLEVVAHEMAHAIIYHYFRIGPSEKIHELLAQYVASQMSQ